MNRRHLLLILLSLFPFISFLSFAFYLRAEDLARYRAEIRERGEWGKAQAQARLDLSKKLAAAALEVKQNDVALLLSVEAFNTDDNYEARNALFTLAQRKNLISIGKPLPHKDWVFALALSPDGKTLATGDKDNLIYFWDVTTQKQIGKPISEQKNWVHAVAFSPDGKILASSNHDQEIMLWDVTTRKRIGEIMVVENVTFGLAFNPDGKTFVSVGRDKKVRLWDVARQQQLGEALTDHTDWVLSVAYAPDGKFFVTSGDKTVRVWDAKTLKSIAFKGHEQFIQGVAVSGDSTLIASGSRDKTARVWDVASGKQIFQLDHTDWVHALAFSPDEKMLATVSRDKLIRLWDLQTGKLIGQPIGGHTEWIDAVSFSGDGRLIATGARDNTVRLWSMSPVVWREQVCKIANRELTNEEWKQYLGDEAHHSICKG